MTRTDPAIIHVRRPIDRDKIWSDVMAFIHLGHSVNVIAELPLTRAIAFRIIPQTEGVLLVAEKQSATGHKLNAAAAVSRGLDELVRLFERA